METSPTRTPFIIFVLGPPASGKGTLCKRLAETYKLYHLSVGDFLRELTKGSLAKKPDIIALVQSGGTKGLVPGEVLVPILIDKIREVMKSGKWVFLLDGFPRDLEQARIFQEKTKEEFNTETPNLTISVLCSRELAKSRYLQRKREDDRSELFDKRYSDYENRDSKVVELYREVLIEIDADLSPTRDKAYDALLENLRVSGLAKAGFPKA